MTEEPVRRLRGTNLPSAPKGWSFHTPGTLAQISPAASLEPLFNGGNPTWNHAVHPALHPRPVVGDVVDHLTALAAAGTQALTLITAASGEGKTCALRQMAVALLRSDRVDYVLWRDDPTIALPTKTLAALADYPGRGVIIADAAHTLIPSITRALETELLAPSAPIQFLLASRTSDWRVAQANAGFAIDPATRWRTWIEVDEIRLTVTIEDARAIVASWDAAGSPPAAAADDTELSRTLMEISELAHGEEGALLGALLTMRFDPPALRAHLATVLDTLSGLALPNGFSVADVAMVLSALDLAQIDGLDREIATQYCGLSQTKLGRDLLGPLEGEAIAGTSALTLLPRHPRISRTVLDLALSPGSNLALGAALDHLLETVTGLAESKGYKYGFGATLNIGSRLFDNSDKSPAYAQLALGRADLARRLQGHRLAFSTAHARLLRITKNPEQAIQEIWTALLPSLLQRQLWTDWNERIRAAWSEFGVSLNMAGRPEAAMIAQAVALSDRLGAPFSNAGIASGLRQISIDLETWVGNGGQPDLAQLVAAEALLFAETRIPDRLTEVAAIRKVAQALDSPPGGRGLSLQAALRELLQAIYGQGIQLEPGWPDPAGLSFEKLLQFG